ncbi:hypothetical protein IFM89_028013 [Coptis chinensis]|uniref:CCHC-type domain-containing protein n=1 Tax=Coptis chinensis TaxID=261450 RepID=A0A835HQ84_9MAGN|nr:hypothetical protein IFM89_028013 [Coptis chinensis]
MGTLRGDRVFVLHYDGFWMPFAPGKVNYSMYRGVERCDYEVNGEEMCYLDLLKEIHKQFRDGKPVSCVKFIARGHLTYFSNDKDMLKMWDLIKPERDKRLNHVPSTTLTTPKAPNQTIAQLRKSPRLHPTPTTPMKAKKLYFEAEAVIDSGVAFEDLVDNEVEDCEGGVSEDDEVDMFIQVGDKYGPSIKLSTAYISEASSDEEDVDFVPNPIDRDSEVEEPDLVDKQPDLDGDNNDEDDDISAFVIFVKLPKNLHMYKNFKSEFKGDYLQSLSWGAAKAYKVPEHITFMDQLEEEELDAKKCLAVMGLLHQRRKLACEMEDNELIPAIRDVIERLEKKHTSKTIQMLCSCYLVRYSNVNRYCSPFYHVNSFRATYGGYIFPFDNEEDWGKVKPKDVVQPPPLERHPGRPKKQRIRGDDEEKATSKRKCKKCLEPGHNKRTCPLGKDQPSKKSRKADEANEAEDIEPEVGNAENNEGERVEEVVAEPTRTRGGRRRAENLQLSEARRGGRTGRAEAANVRRYGTRSGTGRGGGRDLGWWLGEDS